MNVHGVPYRTIRLAGDGWSVEIIDQTTLPHRFELHRLATLEQAAQAIKTMQVRGAPLIGATAAYGMALAVRSNPSDESLDAAARALGQTRPTAVNLAWALDLMLRALRPLAVSKRVAAAYAKAVEIAEDDVETCRAIGQHGVALLRQAAELKPGEPVQVLTHCNAGWLATVDFGTALSPVYQAFDAGIPIHVWVDETRPRNQGAALTAWELGAHGVPHTVIADSAGGHLMQRGAVDLCITGTDRTTRTGDVCNKIGTYQKALAAKDNGIPFYVAVPHSSIDWSLTDGIADIPIEERDATEVTHVTGRASDGEVVTILIGSPGSPAANFAFDVTPRRLVTGLITERGICPASEAGLLSLYPERATVSSPP
ncbi:MAG: S-methyl-5-thioribose-1-phosphate isomerase [Gemmatimonadales bacterium]|nr:S-methyl-5-thioribose-1-phosphate isomerase [Gemmatimonadales bacterium]